MESSKQCAHQRGALLFAQIFVIELAVAVAGCQSKTQAVAPPSKATAELRAARPAVEKAAKPPEPVVIAPSRTAEPAPPAERRTLAELAAAARAKEFDLPPLDDGKIAAAGIRRLEGKHIVVYTDLPAERDVDELPQVFDAAVPLWCDYFGIDRAKVAQWKIVASVMKEKDRFEGAGLYSEKLPDFPHGYNVGSQIWLYDQPSAYFRRHLLLHEGTHAFMLRWLGGAGPPWYMEGMAELLGTHRWEHGKLTLGIMPATKEEVPYWGRIKIIKDAAADGTALSLIDIMRYDAHAHLRVEAYGWCWGAAAFLDQHPLTQAAFRELKSNTRDRSIESFPSSFMERLKGDWPAIAEDWQLFVAECDYGYDVPRAAVIRKATAPLPAGGGTVTLATDRGWQSSGYRLEAGKAYRVTASGRFQIAANPKPWPCEAGGVTLRYSRGRPLGMLLGAVSDLDGDAPPITPLAHPEPIGLAGELRPMTTGTLYLKINEPASGLADNTGSLTVTIGQK